MADENGCSEQTTWREGAEAILATTIIYDNLESGQKAMNLLSRVGALEEEAEAYPHLWQTGLLDDPEWLTAARKDALAAEILVVALGNAEAMKPDLVKLIEFWMGEKGEQDCVLLVLIGSAQTAALRAGPELKLLSSVVEKEGFSFVGPGAELVEE